MQEWKICKILIAAAPVHHLLWYQLFQKRDRGTDRWIDGCVSGWMDGWMDGLEGQTDSKFARQQPDAILLLELLGASWRVKFKIYSPGSFSLTIGDPQLATSSPALALDCT